MKQEEQNLLLQDLCCRLPYGVKISAPELWTNEEKIETLNEIFKGDDDLYRVNSNGVLIKYVKPYLFPMPNKDEDEEYDKFLTELIEIELKVISGELEREHSFEFEMNYYHKNHIDYRGLIPKGLAIDATGKNIY